MTDAIKPEYPSQSSLQVALNPPISEAEYVTAKAKMRHTGGRDGIGRVMNAHQVDVILAPANSLISVVSAAACMLGR